MTWTILLYAQGPIGRHGIRPHVVPGDLEEAVVADIRQRHGELPEQRVVGETCYIDAGGICPAVRQFVLVVVGGRAYEAPLDDIAGSILVLRAAKPWRHGLSRTKAFPHRLLCIPTTDLDGIVSAFGVYREASAAAEEAWLGALPRGLPGANRP